MIPQKLFTHDITNSSKSLGKSLLRKKRQRSWVKWWADRSKQCGVMFGTPIGIKIIFCTRSTWATIVIFLIQPAIVNVCHTRKNSNGNLPRGGIRHRASLSSQQYLVVVQYQVLVPWNQCQVPPNFYQVVSRYLVPGTGTPPLITGVPDARQVAVILLKLKI